MTQILQNENEKSKENFTKVKRCTVYFSDKAKANLKKQQSRYMRKTGKWATLEFIGGKLLETATI